MAQLESKFQGDLIKELRRTYQGCMILKNDANYLQGVPDLIVLYRDRYAMLEVKRKRPTVDSDFQPNQEYYVETLNQMSYAAFIYPENKEDILREIQQVFSSRR